MVNHVKEVEPDSIDAKTPKETKLINIKMHVLQQQVAAHPHTVSHEWRHPGLDEDLASSLKLIEVGSGQYLGG